MTINYRYVFNDRSFTYGKESGIVKSVQANLRGTDSESGLFHEVAILADIPEAMRVKFEKVTKTKALKWLDAEVANTPGLEDEYHRAIAAGIEAQVEKEDEPTPERVGTGLPDGLE